MNPVPLIRLLTGLPKKANQGNAVYRSVYYMFTAFAQSATSLHRRAASRVLPSLLAAKETCWGTKECGQKYFSFRLHRLWLAAAAWFAPSFAVGSWGSKRPRELVRPLVERGAVGQADKHSQSKSAVGSRMLPAYAKVHFMRLGQRIVCELDSSCCTA